MKYCTQCFLIKPFSDFYKQTTGKNGIRSVCKICSRKTWNKWRNNNKPLQAFKAKQQRAANRIWFKAYKSKLKCNHCSENHPACLHFHHINGKLFVVSRGMNRPLNSIKREIAKCIVLCGNCHAKEHYNEYQSNVIINKGVEQ